MSDGNAGPVSVGGGGVLGCTAATSADLARARVLADSFLEHHDGAGFVILVTDHVTGLEPRDRDGRASIRTLADLDFGDLRWEHAASMFAPAMLPDVVRPVLIRSLLHEAPTVIYLDPSSLVLGGLASLRPGPDDAAGYTVIPTRRSPLSPSDDHEFRVEHSAYLPLYNHGCMAFDRRAHTALTWWADRLLIEPMLVPITDTLKADRWFDVGVATFGPRVVRDPGFGVGWWNLDERPFSVDAGRTLAGGEQLRHLQLNGFDPTTPWLLEPSLARAPRVSVGSTPGLHDVVERYARLVTAPDPAIPVRADRMEVELGILAGPIRDVLRFDVGRAQGQGQELPPTPLDDDNGLAFTRWIRNTNDTPGDLPLVAYAAWCVNQEAKERFGNLDDPQTTAAYVTWLADTGRELHPQFPWAELLTPPADAGPVVRVSAEPFGVDLVGYLASEFGLGEAGRRLGAALEAAGVPVSTVAYRKVAHRTWSGYEVHDTFRYDTAILAVNAAELGRLRQDMAPQLSGRTVIGYWHWEVQHALPVDHLANESLLDEIWTPSQFIADLYAPHVHRPVVAQPYPLSLPSDEPLLDREEVGFTDRFTFLLVFDFLSTIQRKNPVGLIEAFRRAFANDEGPVLYLKSMNGTRPWTLGDLEELRWAARGRSDIVIHHGHVEPNVVRSMIAACDCYASLHRSEGVGSTISDAMSHGRPAIATAFSGNLEFMTPETAYLVPITGMVQVGEGVHGYPAEGWWAQPDIEAASRRMRQVYDYPEEAARRGKLAADDLRDRFSPQATGQRMRDRLETIWSAKRLASAKQLPSATPSIDAPPISILSFNRPHYLEQVLESLRSQEPPLTDERVHLFQDGAVNRYSGRIAADEADIHECMRLFEHYFPDGHLHPASANLGIGENTRRAERFLFEECDAELGIFFEDDLLVSPHYLAALAQIAAEVEDQPLIGYFNAAGPHRLPMDQQAAHPGRLRPMGHNWGFALKRSHWQRIAPLMRAYWELVVGHDYWTRPHDEIRRLFASWGAPFQASSQDAAYDAATLAVGAWKFTTTACLARYIGEVGEHFDKTQFEEMGFHDTVMWEGPLPSVTCPPTEVLEQRIAALRAQHLEVLT